MKISLSLADWFIVYELFLATCPSAGACKANAHFEMWHQYSGIMGVDLLSLFEFQVLLCHWKLIIIIIMEISTAPYLLRKYKLTQTAQGAYKRKHITIWHTESWYIHGKHRSNTSLLHLPSLTHTNTGTCIDVYRSTLTDCEGGQEVLLFFIVGL